MGRGKQYELRSAWARPIYVVSGKDFDDLEAALVTPVRPTPSIVRGAALIRELYHSPPPPNPIEETPHG